MPGPVADPFVPSPDARSTRAGPGALRTRLVPVLAALVCGFGLAASFVTLVRAADDGGFLSFLRSQTIDRWVDPLRVQPRYGQDSRLIYRPAAEVRRREARRQARREEVRRAAPKRPPAKGWADARRPRPGVEEASRPHEPRGARPEIAAAAASAPGRRTMCVRTCDGYVFPVGTLHSRDDLDTHRTACGAVCPGAETQLYTLAPGQALGDPSGARSVVDGTAYGRLGTAFLYRTRTVPSCECQPPGQIAHLPLLLDPTLRRGDVVVDAAGEAKAYAGAPRRREAFGDYEGSPALTPGARAQVDRVMGTSVRRRIAADYQRDERRRLAGLRPAEPDMRPGRSRLAAVGPIRETTPPPGSARGVRAYTFGTGGTVHPSGARIIVVQ